MFVIRVVTVSHTAELSIFLHWLSSQPPLRVREIDGVYDIYPPKSVDIPGTGLDDKWVTENAELLNKAGLNAVRAPVWIEDENPIDLNTNPYYAHLEEHAEPLVCQHCHEPIEEDSNAITCNGCLGVT